MPLIHLTRILFAAVAIAFATLGSLPAVAGPYEDAIAQFAQDSFSDSEDAIGKLVASGNPRAAVIITALQDGKLYADPIQFPDKMGQEIAHAIVAHSKGQTLPPQTLIPTKLYRKADGQADASLK